MADIVTRLILKNEQFNSGLAGSGRSLKNFNVEVNGLSASFANGIESMAKYAAKFATIAMAAKGAMNVMKDSFSASEQNIDAWGMACSSASAAWDGFLNSLNTGDISGYMNKIDQITSAAMEAYKELDRLSTQKAINNSKVQSQNVENERFRTMLRTGRYIAPVDGRAPAPGLKEGDKLTPAQLKTIAKQLEGGMAKTRKFVEDDIHQTTKGIEALYKREAATLGMTKAQFKAGTADMATFNKMIAGYEKYKKFEADHTTTSTYSTSVGSYSNTIRDSAKNPYEQYKAWGVFKDDGETFTKINDLINQRAQQTSQLIAQTGQAYMRINKIEGGGGGGGNNTTNTEKPIKVVESSSLTELQLLEDELNTVEKSMEPFAKTSDDWKTMNDYAEQLRKTIADLNGELPEMQEGLSLDTKKGLSLVRQDASNRMETSAIGSSEYNMAMKVGIDAQSMENMLPLIEQYVPELADAFKDTWLNEMAMGLDIPDEAWQQIQDSINEQLQSLGIEPIKLDVETGQLTKVEKEAKKSGKAVQGVADSFNAIGQAMDAIGDPGAKKAGYVASAIGQVAAGYGAASAAAGQSGNPWAWIAFAAAGLATMITCISQIKSVTKGYAEGGIIGGSTYSGDTHMARLNSGEMVINQSDQRNLYDAIHNGNIGGGGGGNSYISGEQIVTVINAYGRRTGRGEILR